MLRVTTLEQFIQKAQEIHKGKYNYEKAIYTKSQVKTIIICPKHGDFEQSPMKHLQGKGCGLCAIEKSALNRKKPIEDFIEQAKQIHHNFYDYSKVVYENNKKAVIIICSLHGEFKQRPQLHLKGVRCKKCAEISQRITFEAFKKRAKAIHKNKYSYRTTTLEGNKTLVTITCPFHGEFKQSAMKHLEGQGCIQCRDENKGWNKTAFQNFCDKRNKGNGFLYVIECCNADERFYKIGISSRKVKQRFDSKKLMPYQYEILYLIEKKGDEVYDLEHKFLRLLSEFKYLPKLVFFGKTECFTSIEPIRTFLETFKTLV